MLFIAEASEGWKPRRSHVRTSAKYSIAVAERHQVIIHFDRDVFTCRRVGEDAYGPHEFNGNEDIAAGAWNILSRAVRAAAVNGCRTPSRSDLPLLVASTAGSRAT